MCNTLTIPSLKEQHTFTLKNLLPCARNTSNKMIMVLITSTCIIMNLISHNYDFVGVKATFGV